MGAAVQDYLREVCRRLLEYDRDIVEIVQFGSSVYAPELSRDVGLLVVTRSVKEYAGYLDAANPEGGLIDVDVVVLGVGDRPAHTSGEGTRCSTTSSWGGSA